jgi:hypothetical protein
MDMISPAHVIDDYWDVWDECCCNYLHNPLCLSSQPSMQSIQVITWDLSANGLMPRHRFPRRNWLWLGWEECWHLLKIGKLWSNVCERVCLTHNLLIYGGLEAMHSSIGLSCNYQVPICLYVLWFSGWWGWSQCRICLCEMVSQVYESVIRLVIDLILP